MLRASGIGLKLGKREILAGVDLELRPGEITALLGPNGAGKSSLLKILSGEWRADRGQVELNGRGLPQYSTRELGLLRAVLPQESKLDFSFSVLEVVLLGRSPHMYGSERPQDYAAAREALRLVDLAQRERDLYTQLSGGEKQRVHLARVLAQIHDPEARQPRYLFLDEPTNNLDLAHRHRIFRAIRGTLSSQVGVCIILHDLNEALQLADDVVILDHGRVALRGEPARIAASPALESIFAVTVRRLELPGSALPYLVFQ